MYNNLVHRYVIRYSNCTIKYMLINFILFVKDNLLTAYINKIEQLFQLNLNESIIKLEDNYIVLKMIFHLFINTMCYCNR